MGWFGDDKGKFFEHMTNLWPGMLGEKKNPEAWMKIWEEELRRFPLSWCLEAIDGIYKRQETTRAPTLRRVKEACEEIERYRHGGGTRTLTTRERMIEELKKYARVRATFLSPKGKHCLVVLEGLSYEREDGTRACLPWADIKDPDLARMLAGGLTVRRDSFFQSLDRTLPIAELHQLPPVPDRSEADQSLPDVKELFRRLGKQWTPPGK